MVDTLIVGNVGNVQTKLNEICRSIDSRKNIKGEKNL